jgi:hypothetical protein
LPEVGVLGKIGVMQIAEFTGPCQLKKSAQPHYLQAVTIQNPLQVASAANASRFLQTPLSEVSRRSAFRHARALTAPGHSR